MSENNDNGLGSTDSIVAALLIGIGSAILVVTIYHCLAMTWCSRRYLAGTNNPAQPQRYVTQIPNSLEHSMTELIPTFQYQKGKGIGLLGGDGTCAICLSEFEEGEELRSLPECMHTYHVACIDMWLYSHSSCPVCRADATSSSQGLLQAMDDLGSERSYV